MKKKSGIISVDITVMTNNYVNFNFVNEGSDLWSCQRKGIEDAKVATEDLPNYLKALNEFTDECATRIANTCLAWRGISHEESNN